MPSCVLPCLAFPTTFLFARNAAIDPNFTHLGGGRRPPRVHRVIGTRPERGWHVFPLLTALPFHILSKELGPCNPKCTFVGTPRGCQFHPSRFDGWLIRSILAVNLRFRLDFLARFDADDVGSFITGWWCAFCGG